MNRKNLIHLAGPALAAVVASPASAQSGPTPVAGTPYIQFVNELSDVGGYPTVSNPNNEFNTTSGGNGVRDACVDIPLPFAFRYYDDETSVISACANGAIGFRAGDVLEHDNWAPEGSPRFSFDTDIDGWLAPFWGDVFLSSQADSSFNWKIGGKAPARYLALEWENIGDLEFSFQTFKWALDMQVRLYEGLSGRIEISYRLEDPGTGFGDSASATAGMEDLNGERGIDFLPNNPNNEWDDLDRDLDGKRIRLQIDPGVELDALTVVGPEFAPLGAPYDVEYSVENLNVNTLGPFDVVVEVSKDPTFPEDETTEIGRNSLTVPQYSVQTDTIEATAPLSLGEERYYHRVCVDAEDTVDEVLEDNNCAVTESRTRYLPSRPDLTVDKVRIPVRQAAPGDTLQVTVQVSNIGSEPVTGVPLAIMLSGNPAISPQDSILGDTDIDLANGETKEIELDVPIFDPINSGGYFIGAFIDIDNVENELNEANNGRAVDFELAIAGGDVAILTTELPNPLVGEPYEAQFTAVGGDGTYLWSIVGQNNFDLPNPGLKLDPGSGLVFGVCSAEGVQSFEIEVESSGDSASEPIDVDCVDPEEPLTIVTREVPDAIIGQEYDFNLIVTGGASAQPENLSWSATNLPMGIEITPSGALLGTAMMPGSQVATLRVTDGTEEDERQVTLNVRDNQNLLLQVETLPTAVLGQDYTAQIEATGGVGRIIFTEDGGELPRGLVLNPDGSITGVPDQVGRFEFDVRAQDNPATGLRAEDRNRFVIDVVAADDSFRVANSELPTAVVDQPYDAAIAAVGGVPPLIWSIEGTLPSGLEAIQTEGSEELIIRGTPDTTDQARFVVVTAIDALDREASKVLVLSVVEEGEDIPECPNPADERCPLERPTEDGGCAAASGSSSSALVGLLFALGITLGVRRRRR